MELKNMNVTKRNGSREPLDMHKSNAMLVWACYGISGVSASEIAMKASVKMYDGIPTSGVQKAFIDAAEELIHEDYHYAEVMSRLMLVDLLKRVYGDWRSIKTIGQVAKENCALGLYDPELFDAFSTDEWAQLEVWIDHDRDYRIKGAGMKQFTDKYLVQDRSTRTVYETPQVAYMLGAAAGLRHSPVDQRMALIKRQYDMASKHKTSLPTPVLAGVRQKVRQYASCILIDVGDDLQSINDGCTYANLYSAKRAGLGINLGRIRPAGSKIGNGEVVSTGLPPFAKKYESSIKSCSQGGIRDASANVTVPCWHYEVEEVLGFKSAKTEEAKAVRRLDYTLQWDSYLLRRGAAPKEKGLTITLFSPAEVPDLYEAFFGKDRSVFERLYEKYEVDTTLKFRKTIPARDLYERFLIESSETARYYMFMADHVNTHSPFLEPIYMTNLCVEVTLPTTPVKNKFSGFDLATMTGKVDFEGLIQLCILSAINAGDLNLDDHTDMESRMEAIVYYLNELIDHMEFMAPQSHRATYEYRPLGIGVINLAYFFAKRGLKYGEQAALDLTHRLGEQMYYYALKASCKYARERNKRVPAWDKLIYSQGRTLRDTYNRRVDELTQQAEECDWPTLLADIAQWGLANSTLLAFMPSESSSTVSNATSGIEPIRALVTNKGNKNKKLVQAAPEPVKYKNQYHMLWDMDAQGVNGYIDTACVLQKHCCQSISVNLSYNPELYPDNKVPLTVLMNHTQRLVKYGGKTRYYINTRGEDDNKIERMMAAVEAAAVAEVDSDDGEDCEACKI
jgi:ribonucleoside-diphosphate reductase alpha chain